MIGRGVRGLNSSMTGLNLRSPGSKKQRSSAKKKGSKNGIGTPLSGKKSFTRSMASKANQQKKTNTFAV